MVGAIEHVPSRGGQRDQFLFAAPAAALYSGVPLAGIVQKYTVLPSALSVCSGFQLPMSKAWETIRVPGFNSANSFGSNLGLRLGGGRASPRSHR